MLFYKKATTEKWRQKNVYGFSVLNSFAPNRFAFLKS